jgi:hypothetical protein
MKMICSMLYSFETDLETQQKFMDLRERLCRPARYLLMGGLRMRSEAEMRELSAVIRKRRLSAICRYRVA